MDFPYSSFKLFQIVVSKSFDANFNPSSLIDRKSATIPLVFQPRQIPSICTTAPESPRGNGKYEGKQQQPPPQPRLRPSMITLQELEAQEEEEDRVLLGNSNSMENSSVHFRSRYGNGGKIIDIEAKKPEISGVDRRYWGFCCSEFCFDLYFPFLD